MLLRFLNAGLRSHTPSIVGLEIGLIAEDGNPYPGLIRQQSAALLPTGKTLDALVAMPAEDVTFALYDRMPTFSNNNLPNGGSLATLQVGAGSPPPRPRPSTPSTMTMRSPRTRRSVDRLRPACLPTTRAVQRDGHGSEPTVQRHACAVNPACATEPSPIHRTKTSRAAAAHTRRLPGNSYPPRSRSTCPSTNDAPAAAADGPYVDASGPTLTVVCPRRPGQRRGSGRRRADGRVTGPPGSGLALNADGSFRYNPGGSGASRTRRRSPGRQHR